MWDDSLWYDYDVGCNYDEYEGTFCKNCGKGPLFWENIHGRYTLYDINNNKHICIPKRKSLNALL